MKSTHELIKNLRRLLPLGPQTAMLVSEAADSLEDLQRKHDEARAEVERLKAELHDMIESYKLNNLQPKTTRPEPSRLEIAAMLKAAWFSNPEGVYDESLPDNKAWLQYADELIAAAREEK